MTNNLFCNYIKSYLKPTIGKTLHTLHFNSWLAGNSRKQMVIKSTIVNWSYLQQQQEQVNFKLNNNNKTDSSYEF